MPADFTYNPTMEKVLIFGGRGFMASHLKMLYPDAILSQVDICDAAAVGKELDEQKPTVVINAAGKTGRPNIDWCEDHKLETVMSNVEGPLVLLKACADRSIYWVHVGSGCTYEGTGKDGGGFTEDETPNFTGSFYARTKAQIDQILKEFPVLQLRVRMPFDGSSHPRSLISKLRKYTKILDEQNSLSYIPDFLKAAGALISKRESGIFNIVNPGTTSPYEIMVKYRELVDPHHAFERLTVEDLGSVTKAGRSNCVLSTQKLQKVGVRLLPIQDAVQEALVALKVSL